MASEPNVSVGQLGPMQILEARERASAGRIFQLAVAAAEFADDAADEGFGVAE
jgi:hypothetical protein